ncbi:MAG: NGG1p interacting factor NIF3 [Candidatus Omnitrophica bacterium]|nr:NGG1p interacting factor NIF3 [Candidatus Omnitrophota bacterium]MBU0896661.1 NGG1p interacting factor NIF3 [Candidatus Omnitrophota bacterium]MBU1134102.1 NGG1p interacting factor NIF3 [Candidatus Omnitrophota bacterium]MBU1366615.1 NGG1p interacting factor NIF3 [Candidatus Omnitrophota bacterium]MBU1523061.1 NGG1p interacting factor NIF3 [Candidatus Omnitrophota bacterium]
MRLKNFYQEVIKRGSEADIRGKREIEKILKKKKEEYEKLEEAKRDFFDLDSLLNPFSDTRILNGGPESNIKSVIAGIDVDVGELLLVDRLKEKGENIDLVVSHHPAGKAYASFYEVMDVQIDTFTGAGMSLSVSENLLGERKSQVERRVNAANHQRCIDAAIWLKLNFLCMHTPCDNLAYQYIRKIIDKEKPGNLGEIMDILYVIPEYRDAAMSNNPPKIALGRRRNRCKRIHLEFTGGTEGPQDIYDKLSLCGIDTIIAMHQSEEHYKKCKEANINVIFASHIASDNLGVNLMFDHLAKIEKLKIYEFSGFRRFIHKKN